MKYKLFKVKPRYARICYDTILLEDTGAELEKAILINPSPKHMNTNGAISEASLQNTYNYQGEMTTVEKLIYSSEYGIDIE
jgi:hypothetical protein